MNELVKLLLNTILLIKKFIHEKPKRILKIGSEKQIHK